MVSQSVIIINSGRDSDRQFHEHIPVYIDQTIENKGTAQTVAYMRHLQIVYSNSMCTLYAHN